MVRPTLPYDTSICSVGIPTGAATLLDKCSYKLSRRHQMQISRAQLIRDAINLWIMKEWKNMTILVENNQELHSSLNGDIITNAWEENNGVGFCISCGYMENECFPGDQKVRCMECDNDTVYHAVELAYMVLV